MDAMKKALMNRRGKGIELTITIDPAGDMDESEEKGETDLAPDSMEEETEEAPMGLAERMKMANPSLEHMDQEVMPSMGKGVETPTGKVPNLLARATEELKKKKGY